MKGPAAFDISNMNITPLVSVILPSLNVVSYIREAVESVINQTLKDIEIICVDAGSTDGTLEILREYEATDPRVKVIVSNRKSYGFQMNLGMEASHGKYLGIVETDDWVIPEMFEELYTIAEKNKVDFVKSDYCRFKTRSDGSLEKVLFRLSEDASYYNRVLCPGEEPRTFHFPMNTWSGIYNMDFLRKWNIRHNETPGASYQDNGFWFQTFCRAKRVLFVDKVYYMNRRDNENSSVYSKGKVFCMRDEYDYIRQIIEKDINNLGRFIPQCNFFRFCGYYYNTLFRIAPEYRREFLNYFSDEFRKLANKNELDRTLFNKWEWDVVTRIMYDPDNFYLQNLQPKIKPIATPLQYADDIENAPTVSIIVPVYNVEAYLAECMDTLLRQTFTDFEIICVNDGSTDRSSTILKQYSDKDSRIRIISQENRGLSSARNTGLCTALGKYICFVDSDDGLKDNALEILVDNAEKNNADIVVFGFETEHFPVYETVPQWLTTKNTVRNIVFPKFTPAVLFDEPGSKPLVWRDMFRRSLLRDNNLFFNEDCRFGEDTIFQFSIFPEARIISFIKERLYLYRCSRPESLMSTHNSEKQVQKCKWHIRIISYISALWEQENLLEQMLTQFANWAVDFFYGEFNMLDVSDKATCAEQFIKVISRFCADEQRLLTPGRQSCVKEIRECIAENDKADKKDLIFSAHDEILAPKISFVVPTHNMGESILDTMSSLLNQTEPEIEVICIDDASTDDTLDKLRSVAYTDKRLRIIHYESNKTANQARKDGVLASRGQYILFCDADDSYDLDACEKLYAEMNRNPVDILHFGIHVISHNASEDDKKWIERNIHPFDGELYNDKILPAAFSNGLFSKNLWDKMYSAELAKKAFSQIQNGRFPRGQDIYAFFLLAYYARTYRGNSSVVSYNYNLGTGMDGTKTLDAVSFAPFCSFHLVIEALKAFLEKENKFEEYKYIWLNLRSNMIGDCVNKWHKKVSSVDKGKCLDQMIHVWPAWAVIESVARRYWNQPDKLYGSIIDSELFSITKPNVKVIGTYYHKCVNGGVEKVMEALTRIWVAIGYRVVIITDLQGPEDTIELPVGVKRYSIPNFGVGKPGDFYVRARELQKIIFEEGIDLMVYHAWNTQMLSWDMLLTKAAGCAFLIHCHSAFSLRLRENSAYFASMPRIYRAADGIVCLSEMDREFWRHFNPNVIKVLNPIPFDIEKCVQARSEKNTILWVGRLSPEKHPEAVIRAFEEILKEEPEASLCIVGSAEDPGYENELHDLALSLGVEESIIWAGFQKDVKPYYEKASVLACTSEYEGFHLVLVEAISHGLPVVMFSLPYLTIVKNNASIISVAQNDCSAMAHEITMLFQDPEKQDMMRRAARRYALELAEYDYNGVWKEIIASIGKKHEQADITDAENLMWETLLDNFAIGVEKRINQEITKENQIISKLQAEDNQIISKLQAEDNQRISTLQYDLDCVHNSVSFRIGRAITFMPRKVRGGIRCIQDNGPKYTFWRALYHFGIRHKGDPSNY